jgi:hypothetical protein
MNRKHFLASAAAAAALAGGVAREAAEASGSGTAPVTYPGEARIAALELAVYDLIAAVNTMSAQLAKYAPSINTAIEDNDVVHQAQSASNRQQIVTAGGWVVADGQVIDQKQCAG